MGSPADGTVRRLRELNGVLELAVMNAARVIAEHVDADGRAIQERLIRDAARELQDVGRFPGRFCLYSDQELRILYGTIAYARGDNNEWDANEETRALHSEVEFEMVRRGMDPMGVAIAPADDSQTARDPDERGGGDGQRG